MAQYVDISYEEFRTMFESVADPRDAALFAVVYCCYGRIGEVVRSKYSKAPSILRSNIKFTANHLMLKVRTEKVGSSNPLSFRTVPSSRELEDWLHEPIRNYLDSSEGEEVFPISTFWAEKRFEKWFGTQHIHLLRHWACTHCLQGHRTKERLKAQDVARLGGWTNLNTFYRVYSHVAAEDMMEMI